MIKQRREKIPSFLSILREGFRITRRHARYTLLYFAALVVLNGLIATTEFGSQTDGFGFVGSSIIANVSFAIFGDIATETATPQPLAGQVVSTFLMFTFIVLLNTSLYLLLFTAKSFNLKQAVSTSLRRYLTTLIATVIVYLPYMLFVPALILHGAYTGSVINRAETAPETVLLLIGHSVLIVIALIYWTLRIWPLIFLAMDGQGIAIRKALELTHKRSLSLFIRFFLIVVTLGLVLYLITLGGKSIAGIIPDHSMGQTLTNIIDIIVGALDDGASVIFNATLFISLLKLQSTSRTDQTRNESAAKTDHDTSTPPLYSADQV